MSTLSLLALTCYLIPVMHMTTTSIKRWRAMADSHRVPAAVMGSAIIVFWPLVVSAMAACGLWYWFSSKLSALWLW